MKLKITISIIALLVGLGLPVKSKAQIKLIKDYSNKYSANIGTFHGITYRESGFSGMYPIPNTNGTEFWIVSDRGVNIDGANANPSTCRPTYDKIYAFPNYAPKLHRVRVMGDSVQILQTIPIKRPNGTGATGLINPTGFGSTALEVPSTDTVMNCANFSLKTVAKDVWGIDAEGVVIDKDGNFWICEEGGPSIWVINASGVVQKRFSPYANLAGAQPQDIMIDSCFKYRKNNRGFEGIAIAPNGKIYAIIQSPILYPSKSVGEATKIHRILEINPLNNATKMYVYLNDGVIGSGSDQIRLRDWKIGDMAAINDSTFLVLEAAKRGTTDIRNVYHININGASTVHSGLYGGVTLEALVDETGLASNGIVPVKKTLFMDLMAYGWDPNLDKAEGLAIINDSTIAICNDNDYGQFSANEDGLATATNNVGHVVVYGLEGNNKLKNYTPITFNQFLGTTGPSTSQTPYLVGTAKDVKFTSILSSGDYINNYRMCGTPDGLGAFDNNDGTFTLVMNHEFGNTAGIARAHGSKGSFVSKWIINKSDLSVISGSDLIQNVYLWNGTGYSQYNASNPSNSAAFSRFCSADLPEVSAFYNSKTGNGTTARIFMNGEESGSSGRAFAHIVTGSAAGSTYELPYLGKCSWENSVACPNESDKTIVIGLDDATPGQIYVYVGNKSKSGNDIEKAGLTGGKLYGIGVNGMTTESSLSLPNANTSFSLVDLGEIYNMDGSSINSISNTLGVTNFLRPEDGAWDPSNPNDFYFNTTNSFSSPSRLWRVRFTDINNPELGGTVTAVLDGTEGQKMLDNLGIDNFGNIVLTEDVGNNVHIGKIWNYNIATDELLLVGQHDENRFLSGATNYLTQDEESSGIIDVQSILGPGMFLIVDQAHYGIPGEQVEGGQLLAMFNPITYNANPEISVLGNNMEIMNADNSADVADNTDFGAIAGVQVKTYSIRNTGKGILKVQNIAISGKNAIDFTLLNVPAFPLTIPANGSINFTVKFTPSQLGLRTANVEIMSNDVDEKNYMFAIQATALEPGAKGPSSSQSPYLLPTVAGGQFTAVLTAGDYIDNYRMSGLPDGMGAFDNGNGTFTLVMNHEISSSLGVVRAHGNKGSYVSKWIIKKSDLTVMSGSDLIQNVYLWNGTSYTKYNATNVGSKATFNRFCSADLPAVSAFYNSKTGLGTQERIFMNGEESGSEGRGFAHIITGSEAGSTYELPYLGKFSWENSVACPNESNKTIVVGTDDATPGQIYVYIGTKTNTGTDIDKAGLNGGKLYGIAVTGLLTESSSNVPAENTAFTLADLGQVQNMTGSAINTASNNAGVTNFLRPEDAAWDPANPSDLYFVTTNSFNSPSRMWRVRFTDINNPEMGGTVTAVLDGTEGQRMLDNMTIDKFGHALLQEDVGNNVHNGKIWQYNIATDELIQVAKHDETRFLNGGANYLTQDEESSGIFDAQEILGPGMFLLNDQAHYSLGGELVEGGQLLAFYNPSSFMANPEVMVTGNGEEIRSGSIAPKTFDNSDFGSVKVKTTAQNMFEVSNHALGDLIVKAIEINGNHASEFTLVNAPSFPWVLSSGASQTFEVKFSPLAIGLRTANITVVNNDFDEYNYSFKIQGNSVANTSIDESTLTELKVYPNPSNNSARIDFGLVNSSEVEVKVVDLQGKIVSPIILTNLEAGKQTLDLNTSDLSNGMYIIEFLINGKVSRYRLAVIH